MKILQITYNCLNLHQRCEPRLHSAKRHKVSLPSLARALPEKVEMKHQVNSSWVSYGYDGMGRKLCAEYSESLLKSAMPQSSVMGKLLTATTWCF